VRSLHLLSNGGISDLMENKADIGVLVPHFLMMRDSRVIPIADKLWEKSGKNKDMFIDNTFDFITTNVYYITDKEAFGQEEFMQMPGQLLLETGAGDCGNSAQAMVSLLFFKGVPSRMTFGYALGQSHRWVEAQKSDGVWRVYDTTNGHVFTAAEREKFGYDALFWVTPYSFALAKIPILPPLFLP